MSIAEGIPAEVDSDCFSLGGSVAFLGGEKGMTERPQSLPVRALHRPGFRMPGFVVLGNSFM